MSNSGDAIKQLRTFHAGIKESLISRHVLRGNKVVDLGSGVGGDMFKFVRAGASSVVAIDLSESNLQEAQRRCTERGKTEPDVERLRKASSWHVCDATKSDQLLKLARVIGQETVDVVNCHFLLQYICGSRDQFTKLFEWAAFILKRGGVLVATAPNGATIRTMTINGPFRSDVMSISRIPRLASSEDVKGKDSSDDGEFGHQIKFHMFDSRLAQNLDEFMLPVDAMCNIAKQCGFRLVELRNFADIYASLDSKRRMSRSEEECSSVNFSAVFQKI